MKWEIFKNWFFSYPNGTFSDHKIFLKFFIPLYNNFIPCEISFSDPKKNLTFFIPFYNNFIPCETGFVSCCAFISYQAQAFRTMSLYFIPSGQVFIPHATNFILIISFSTHLIARLIVCIHSVCPVCACHRMHTQAPH
jgi:hypothetical protein